MKKLIAILTLPIVLLLGSAAGADSSRDAPVTRATTFHGLPGNNPGFSDEQFGACPAGAGANCDGGLHNIAGIKARQGRNGGTPPACTAHGGLGAANKNC